MYANHTLPKTNSEFSPENGWLEDAFPFRKAYFTGPCWFQGGYHPNFHVSCSTPTTFHCLHLMMCPNIVPLSSICIVFWYSGRVHINKQTSDFVFTSTNISNNTPTVFRWFSSQQFDTTKHPPNIHQRPVDQGPSWRNSDLFFGAGRRAGDQMAGDPQLSHRLWTTPQIWDGLDTQATCKNPSKIHLQTLQKVQENLRQ